METRFHFVDGHTKLDKTSRRLMKSHVMKGKNAGRKIHRQSRLALQARRQDSSSLKVSREVSCSSDNSKPTWPAFIARNMGNPLLTFSFPLDPTPQALQVIDQFFVLVDQRMYTSQLGLYPDEATSRWLAVLLSDEASSHCVLALMESFNHFLTGKGACSQEALRHISRTLALVNTMIQSKDALADSTLAIVLMLVIQEQVRQEQAEAEIHFDGLRKMISLRGGLSQLEGNPTLLLKICKIDITYALQFGRPIHFFRDHMLEVHTALASNGFSIDKPAAALLIRHRDLDPWLFDILADITALNCMFNNLAGNTTINLVVFEEMIVSLFSRLLWFQSINDATKKPAIEDVYHIGLTIYMMTMFLQHDNRRVVGYDLVSTRLTAVMERNLEGLDNDLLLWIVFMDGIWNSGSRKYKGAWLFPLIKNMLQRLDMTTWTEAYDHVSAFPWIKAVHDPLGQALWDLVTCSGRVES